MRRTLLIWLTLAGAALAAFALALASGSTHLAPNALLQALISPGDSLAGEIVARLRLPRALAAFAVGGLLALAGALMQVLLRNPLADPYVLGLSGGAAVGALGAMLAGLGALAVNLGAGAGALLAIALVFAFARRDFARQQMFGALDASPRLLLTGVIMAAGWGALITLMLTLAPEARLRGMLFWLMGDLNGVDSWAPALLVLAGALAVSYPAARELNVLLRGEVLAHALGVRVVALRRMVYLLASVATALAVTTAGAIGFVGLVVPHALRLALGNDQRMLLPASALAGGTLLLLADTAARSLLAPQQLPVGVITALLGVPAFLFLLTRKPGEGMNAPLLEAQNLSLRVGGRTLVRELSFRLGAGEVWCMLGPNGAGKSTFLHTAVGLREAQGGALRLAGKPLVDWPAAAAARQRSFLPQTFHDAFSASVLESVMLGRHPYLSRWQWEGAEERALALAALEAVDLAGFERRDVLTLSGGERQRVALAALIAQDAPLLLLDEPVSHLDLHHQVLVLEHLVKLARVRAKGVLFTVHDLDLAARFASHALLLTPQATVLHGPIASVMTEAALQDAFGHRVTRVEAAGRTLFVPD